MASENENESEKREALADIVADMRAYAKRCREENFCVAPECEEHYNEDDVEDLADRIEAAWKRDKAEAEADALAVGGIVEAERHTPGNAAAMREALEAALRFIGNLEIEPYSPLDEDASECRQRIMDAISAPARQCDVGTAEEQTRRFREYCGGRCIAKCKVYEKGIALGIVTGNDYYKTDCRFIWAQTPYEELKGENDGM